MFGEYCYAKTEYIYFALTKCTYPKCSIYEYKHMKDGEKGDRENSRKDL